MKIKGIFWLDRVVNKLARKHHVETYEVEEIFMDKPRYHRVQRGARKGEDVYLVLGQTKGGRYLAVLFICKQTKQVLILSARDMAGQEKRQYARK